MTDFRGAEMQALEHADRMAAAQGTIRALQAENAAMRGEIDTLRAERDNLSLSFCNAVTRCSGAEATLSALRAERDNAVRTAHEMAQAVVDLSADLDKMREDFLQSSAQAINAMAERDAAVAEIVRLRAGLRLDKKDGTSALTTVERGLRRIQELRDAYPSEDAYLHGTIFILGSEALNDDIEALEWLADALRALAPQARQAEEEA